MSLDSKSMSLKCFDVIKSYEAQNQLVTFSMYKAFNHVAEWSFIRVSPMLGKSPSARHKQGKRTCSKSQASGQSCGFGSCATDLQVRQACCLLTNTFSNMWVVSEWACFEPEWEFKTMQKANHDLHEGWKGCEAVTLLTIADLHCVYTQSLRYHNNNCCNNNRRTWSCKDAAWKRFRPAFS